MNAEDIIKIIEENNLTIRHIPKVTVSYWTYREGDEERINRPAFYSDGRPITNRVQSVVTDARGRKMIKHECTTDSVDLWRVKETPHTDSTVRFSKSDFCAETLEKAIELFLKSKEKGAKK